nr:hypothetical protein [Tanacetum cinerariifolium]
MILSPGHTIPHGRPYRYHPNGPVHMMNARKRVRPLPVQQLFVRHSVDHSLLKDIGYLADVDVDPREPRDERVMHPAMPEDIPKPAQEGAAEVTYETLGDLVQRFHDHTQAIPVHQEMKAREVARNLEALNENEEEQEGENGGNENGGNGGNGNGDNGGNGNEGNGNHGMNYGGFMPMARECTF